MLAVFCSPSRYTQGKSATAVLGAEMAGLGLQGPALLVAGRSACRLLSETWKRTFKEARITHVVVPIGKTEPVLIAKAEPPWPGDVSWSARRARGRSSARRLKRGVRSAGSSGLKSSGAELLAGRWRGAEPGASELGPPPKGMFGIAESLPGWPECAGKARQVSCRQQGARAWRLRSANVPIGRTRGRLRNGGLFVGGLDCRCRLRHDDHGLSNDLSNG